MKWNVTMVKVVLRFFIDPVKKVYKKYYIEPESWSGPEAFTPIGTTIHVSRRHDHDKILLRFVLRLPWYRFKIVQGNLWQRSYTDSVHKSVRNHCNFKSNSDHFLAKYQTVSFLNKSILKLVLRSRWTQDQKYCLQKCLQTLHEAIFSILGSSPYETNSLLVAMIEHNTMFIKFFHCNWQCVGLEYQILNWKTEWIHHLGTLSSYLIWFMTINLLSEVSRNSYKVAILIRYHEIW